MSRASSDGLDFDENKSESNAIHQEFTFTEPHDKENESMHNSMW